MKRFLIILMAVFCSYQLSAQAPAADTFDLIFTKIPIIAEYKGGEIALRKFLVQHLRYPEGSAALSRFHGLVQLKFVVGTTGKLSDIEVINTVDKPMADEAIRVLMLTSGRWSAAVQCGRFVKSYEKFDFDIPARRK